jgi:hypothetical protein
MTFLLVMFGHVSSFSGVTSAQFAHPNQKGVVNSLTCKEVIRQISEYVDAGLDADTLRRLEQHFAGCRHCSAILDGTRNVIRLMGDGRSFELPAHFDARLRERLKSAQLG